MHKALFLPIPVVLLLSCLLSGLLVSPVAALEQNSPASVSAADVREWEATFSRIERYLEEKSYVQESSLLYYDQLAVIRAQAVSLRDTVARQQQNLINLLEALGEKPAEGEAPESDEIAAQRSRYQEELNKRKAERARAELALVRVDELSNGLSLLRRGLLVDELLTRYPMPFMPHTVLTAGAEVVRHVGSLLVAPGDWYNSLSADQRARINWFPTIVITLVSVILGILLRRWILRRYGRVEAHDTPGFTQKMTAAVAEGVARGLVPLLTLLGLSLWLLQHQVEVGGLFADMLHWGFRATVYFIVLTALASAVLSPDHPDWRLIEVHRIASRVIGYATILLIGVSALDMFVSGATRSLPLSGQMQSVYITIMMLAKGALLMLICLSKWWAPTTQAAGLDEEGNPLQQSVRLVDTLRRLIALIAAAGMVASLAGYAGLGVYLIDNVINSAIYMLALTGARAVLLELLGGISRSRLFRKQFAIAQATLSHVRAWLGGAITAAFMVAGGVQLALVWGVSGEDLSHTLTTALTGFTVGSITISVTDILLALLVFFAVMALTRLLQRSLMSSILPQFTENRAVQYSLSSGAGYIGILLAILMFVAALGIKLESIALVAGALSVGIGFGLQNIVNNFVSGLILIMERPIKVGDWVIVGDKEGYVQQINFRATELETFQRASVIIPNAEMLSNAVTNMTYRDTSTRVEVPVQVAYESNPDQVMGILEAAAREQNDVLRYPRPVVHLLDFGADGLNFELRCFARDAAQKLGVATRIRLYILKRFDEEGIEIPYPQRVLRIREGESLAAETSAGADPAGGTDPAGA
ncbi:mechanosensitive ion channel [Granulosicoccaceae sp. 1_MG-2023]|nr:mechanosensitive ion channel [Granulosicoccaceae sp. 1_MG-2023]